MPRSFTRSQIQQLIARGHLLVLHHDTIYRLNSWAAKHPGGALAILHFVGRNAAAELEAYHDEPTVKRMRAFAVGQVAKGSGWTEARGWEALVPPVQLEKGWERLSERVWSEEVESWVEALAFLDDSQDKGHVSSSLPPLSTTDLEPSMPLPPEIVPEHQRSIDVDWFRLHERVKAEGLYDGYPMSAYRDDLLRYSALAIGAAYFYFTATSNWQLLLSAFLLGCFKHQLTFTAHDAGHRGVTGNFARDRILGIFIADFLGGMSIGWWCDNSPEHDPDIQHMPFFAISQKFFSSPYSTYYRRTLCFDAFARFFVQFQNKIYYFLLAFGRPNLFVNSYSYLLLKAKPGFYRNLEVCGILFFWTWFTLLLRGIATWQMRVAYVLVCFVTTSPLHVQIVLSHFAQSTADLGVYESFANRQLRTTMDVTCPTYLDFIHGGLHMQVSHHLFPRVPRHNLRRLNVLVREFASKHGLEYHTYTFTEGNGRVLSVLEDVARQVRVLAKVAKAQAAGELH